LVNSENSSDSPEMQIAENMKDYKDIIEKTMIEDLNNA